jgi:hypothetical protein
MAGNLAHRMPTASNGSRPTPTGASNPTATSPARRSQISSPVPSFSTTSICASFASRAACHDCWNLTTVSASSLEAWPLLCSQPVCKNLNHPPDRRTCPECMCLILARRSTGMSNNAVCLFSKALAFRKKGALESTERYS